MTGSGKAVGALVQRLREQAGLSMSELAEASGIDKASVSRIEHGEFNKPKEETLTAIAKTFGVDPTDLLSAAGYANPSTLPSFRPYLRTKYGHLPPNKLAELEAIFRRIADEQPNDNQTKEPKGGPL